MENDKNITNREWIAKGNTGCVYATMFAKAPEKVGWKFMHHLEFIFLGSRDSLLVAIEFPPPHPGMNWNKEMVRHWALDNGFYEEDVDEECVGLRRKCKEGVSWVQYFGPDSHVVTRQSPYPMLMYTNKLGVAHYVKVGWNGILHLAHAWYSQLTEAVYNLLWDRSYEQTAKRIGHKPTVKEAAKTTWLKKDI